MSGVFKIFLLFLVSSCVSVGLIVFLSSQNPVRDSTKTDPKLSALRENSSSSISFSSLQRVRRQEMEISSGFSSSSVSSKDYDIINSGGKYLDFDSKLIAQKSAEGRVVLFFTSQDCGDCKVLHQDIITNFNNFPSDLTIFKVNFDTDKQTVEKYSITSPNSLVLVDSEGNLLKSWQNSFSLKDIIEKSE